MRADQRTYAVARACELPNHATDVCDTVFVSAALAAALDCGDRPLAIAAAPMQPQPLVPTVFWAALAPPEMEDDAHVGGGEYAVFVPGAKRAWHALYGIHGDELAVLPVAPVPLSATVVTAESLSGVDTQSLQQSLHGRILRSGTTVAVGGTALHVAMCEPVAQGVVDGAATSVYIVQAPPKHAPQSAGSGAGAPQVATDVSLEAFLEHAAADDVPRSAAYALTTLDEPSHVHAAIARYQKSQGTTDSGAAYVDPESVVLLSDGGLAQLAAFDGDWAVASAGGEPRLVRLFADPTVTGTDLPGAAISPLLAYNLCGGATGVLSLRPLPAHVLDEAEVSAAPPLVPAAESVTIARIASPVSTDRAYEDLCVDALRRHLEKPRLLRQGDVFAVAIQPQAARFLHVDVERERSAQGSTEGLPPGSAPAYSGAVVHFCVTELSPALADPAELRATLPANAAGMHNWLTALAAEGMDRFGCWVDVSHARVVQSGEVQRRVADAAAWLGVQSDAPLCPRVQTPLTAPGSVFARYVDLVSAAMSSRAQQLDVRLGILLTGAHGTGKRTLTRWVGQRTGVHVFEMSAYELVSDTDARTEGIFSAKFERARACAPCIVLLRDVDALVRKGDAQVQTLVAMLRRCVEGATDAKAESDADSAEAPPPLVLVGTAEDAEKLPPALLTLFNQTLRIDPPGESERREILDSALRRFPTAADVDAKGLAVQTAALVAADLVDIVERARLGALQRLSQRLQLGSDAWSERDVAAARPVLVQSDLMDALGHVRSTYSESIGAPKIPSVSWDDVGGLAAVKDEILDTVQLPLEHPELFSDGVKKRSGVLLYGPPGTGKTLLAKAVATTCSLNFFSVKGPELLNMYIGESEANVRRVFQRARDAKPCVIFFDELDSIAPKRGNHGDSGGVMDRIVSQLLAELDGMASGSAAADVFVIGATNRPDLLDQALLRPGRFDRMLYLSVAETHDAQLNILQALTRKFRLAPDVGDMRVIAEQCPFNLTGADFYALCSDAMLKAMTRKASDVDKIIAELNAAPTGDHPYPLTPQYYLSEMAAPHEIEVQVSRADFELALKELVPSVSAQEMAHYREVQKKFSQPEPEKAGAPEAPAPQEPQEPQYEISYVPEQADAPAKRPEESADNPPDHPAHRPSSDEAASDEAARDRPSPPQRKGKARAP
ncbi:peroxisomal assembly protein [Malassezia cuniculi]|uniref:Peroxisomal ATPase PEX6 n=1 Tax=Malassezia cuniculi TaxID=948313 RepID=A0AAF0F0U0_9BASI|nr:peroxisomal assembly protein [Malassezia cuniculi]